MNRTNISLLLVSILIIGTIWKDESEQVFPWSGAMLNDVIGLAGNKIVMVDFETEW